MSYDYQVAILGGGPGGYECAIRCAQLGLKTCLVEARDLGGTCLNRGCIPTKALLHGAEVYEGALNAAVCGVSAENIRLDYAKLAGYKEEKVMRLRKGVEALEKANGVDVIRGFGKVAGAHTLQVGDRTITWDKLILAMGSAPAKPPVPGMETAYTSDDVLSSQFLVSSFVIIGGGVIGLEFATLFATLGKKVTIVEMMPEILPGVAPEITSKIKQVLKKKGVEFILGAKVTSVEKGRVVNFEKDGKADTRKASAVIVCAGRRPMTKDCGLETIGLETTRGFVMVDDHLRTAVEDVYAIGDISVYDMGSRIGNIQLAHVASAQGMVAAANCAGKDETMNYDIVPACIYTSPEIAYVGLSEEKAKEKGIETVSGSFNVAGNGRSLVMNETTGLIKLVADKATGKVIGCQMMAPRATDMIAEVAVAIAHGATMESLGKVIHPHPTVSEIVKEAAHDSEGLCINGMPHK